MPRATAKMKAWRGVERKKLLEYGKMKNSDVPPEHQAASQDFRFNRARFTDEVAWALYQLMRRLKVSNSELARRLGCSKPYITKVMEGSNLTLDSVADLFFALGRYPHVVFDIRNDLWSKHYGRCNRREQLPAAPRKRRRSSKR